MINEIDVREQVEPYGEISDINVKFIRDKLFINSFVSFFFLIFCSIFLHVVVPLFVLKNVQMHQDV
jgi:hypothetical protein